MPRQPLTALAFDAAAVAAKLPVHQLRMAVNRYTGGYYPQIRDVLRLSEAQWRTSYPDDDYAAFRNEAELLDLALLVMPQFEGTLYRGIMILPRGLAPVAGSVYLPGTFNSFSRIAPNRYTRRMPIVLRVREATIGVTIESVSAVEGEFEVLVPSSIAYQVRGVRPRATLSEDDILFSTIEGGLLIDLVEIRP